MRAGVAFLALAGCSSAAGAEVFEIVAYEARGIEPTEAEVIIPDARVRIPAFLKSCGVETSKTVDATDGVVLFRFSAEEGSSELECVRAKLPAGTQLHQVAYQ